MGCWCCHPFGHECKSTPRDTPWAKKYPLHSTSPQDKPGNRSARWHPGKGCTGLPGSWWGCWRPRHSIAQHHIAAASGYWLCPGGSRSPGGKPDKRPLAICRGPPPRRCQGGTEWGQKSWLDRNSPLGTCAEVHWGPQPPLDRNSPQNRENKLSVATMTRNPPHIFEGCWQGCCRKSQEGTDGMQWWTPGTSIQRRTRCRSWFSRDTPSQQGMGYRHPGCQ